MEWFNEIINDIMSDEVTIAGALFKLALSPFLGAMVGIERKRKGQIAGTRTFALISTGATLAMLVSIYIPQEYMGLKNGDPGRIAAQVISGIGFLGAGAIIQMRGSVRGLTTAAGIWMTAAIGLAIGAGMYVIGVCAAFMIMFILLALEHYGHHVNLVWESKIIRVKLKGVGCDVHALRSILEAHNIPVTDLYLKYAYEQDFTIVNFIIKARETDDFVQVLQEISEKHHPISATLTNEVNI